VPALGYSFSGKANGQFAKLSDSERSSVWKEIARLLAEPRHLGTYEGAHSRCVYADGVKIWYGIEQQGQHIAIYSIKPKP
jgi:hypothetical protein